MLDPVTTPLLFLVLGKLADDVIGGACKDYLKGKLKGLFSKAEKLGSKDDLEVAYEGAMQQAYETCCEVLLRNIETFGVARNRLRRLPRGDCPQFLPGKRKHWGFRLHPSPRMLSQLPTANCQLPTFLSPSS